MPSDHFWHHDDPIPTMSGCPECGDTEGNLACETCMSKPPIQKAMLAESRETAKARLDADGTAKPKTRIIQHPKEGWCIGPGMALRKPELENTETGERIPLSATDCVNCGHDVRSEAHARHCF